MDTVNCNMIWPENEMCYTINLSVPSLMHTSAKVMSNFSFVFFLLLIIILCLMCKGKAT